MTHRNLRPAMRLGLLPAAVAVALVPAVAGAQEAAPADATTLDRIEVTGSRIRQVDLETAQPVLMISREDIEGQGFNTVADILQNISAAGSPAISRSDALSSGEAVGGAYIDLRNLGAERTLVLVNGKRLGITTSGLQDISTIPSSIVERIEVLKDGASSIYGSDAMAGVINIITRRNFDGAEVNAYFGQYGEGDGTKQNYDFVTGFAGDRGSVTISGEYHNEDAVWAKDRYFSADSYPGFPQYSNSVVGKWGNFNINSGLVGADGKPLKAEWYAADRDGDALGLDDFHPQTGADTSNAADQMHLITPLERRSLFASADWNITDDIRFVADMAYSDRSSNRQIAGYPVQSTAIGAPMSADSYFNPLADQDRAIDWRRRGWEVPRTTQSDLTTWRFTGQLEGFFQIGDRYFDWDAGTLYNQNKLTVISNGNLYKPNVRKAVGPSFMNDQGQIVCGTPDAPIADCVAWNPFAGFGTGDVAHSLADPDVQKYLYKTEHALGETETTAYFANLAGSLFTLPAGDLGFAVGYEHRKEEGGYSPDAIAQTGDSTNLAAGPTRGQYALDEFYAELSIPLLADVAFAEELTLSVASRYSDYDTFGDTTNSKFGFAWRPYGDLLVRGTWAEGFRAPAIADLYGGGSESFVTGFMDPCDSVYGDAAGSARCLQDVGANYRQLQQGFVPTESKAAQTPVPFTSGSNPNLQPETSVSKNLGFVYSPSFVEGLSVGVDWWNIRIENTMISDSANQIMQDCYVALIESRCANFERDPVTGIVSELTYGLRNAGYVETEGFDVDVGYRFNTGYGNFTTNWQTTYVSKNVLKTTNEEGTPEQVNNGFGSNFRVRSNLNVGWKLDDFSVNWGTRYYSGVKEQCYFDEVCNIPDYAAPDTHGENVPMNRVGSVTFHDVQASWSAPWNATIAVGANDVFDRQGPVMYSGPNSSYSYYGGYDIGRFVYMKYQQRF
ncbi:TonB-dependent receptor [Lysobacter arseniciresistens ZS79]|uniref:TonB-dependent receptor n=1 Tax=Lysobacter arseniciresistens ZS79 TaxID=913325 RepID=A0A0A0EZ95_9GAMM|nr:TonB-dependent receptor [Lysobacter arseniciresistens]KGM54467.1 TonB-dependent receptor [Lysobacter arseniciresistens ZS79]